MPLTVPLLEPGRIVIFLLVLTRVGGLFLTAPVLSQGRIPPLIKAGASALIALFLAPLVTPPGLGAAAFPELLGMVVKELAVGALLGLLASLLFAGVTTGGQMVGFQMGLTYAGAVDPQFNTNMSPVAEFMNLTALLLFLLVDGHHHLLRALALSYRLVPAGTFELTGPRLGRLITASGGMFLIALQIAAPVIVMLLLSDVAMGLLSRFIPQMNIFIVGAPLKIGVGLAMLAVAMPLFGAVLTAAFSTMDRQILLALGGG